MKNLALDCVRERVYKQPTAISAVRCERFWGAMQSLSEQAGARFISGLNRSGLYQ